MKRHNLFVSAISVLMISGVFIAQSHADESNSTFTPYLWTTGLKGEIATLPPATPVEVDIGFSDIWDNLDLALMGVLDLRNESDWGLFVDLLYVDIDTDEVSTAGPVFADVRYDMQLTSVILGGAKRWDQPDGFADLILGMRYWDADNRVRLGAAVAPAFEVVGSDNWVDFVIGGKGLKRTSEKWALHGWLIAGGGDSESMYDIMGGFNYTLNNGIVLSAGYRHMAVDYEEGPFLFDVEMSGPIFGASFKF